MGRQRLLRYLHERVQLSAVIRSLRARVVLTAAILAALVIAAACALFFTASRTSHTYRTVAGTFTASFPGRTKEYPFPNVALGVPVRHVTTVSYIGSGVFQATVTVNLISATSARKIISDAGPIPFRQRGNLYLSPGGPCAEDRGSVPYACVNTTIVTRTHAYVILIVLPTLQDCLHFLGSFRASGVGSLLSYHDWLTCNVPYKGVPGSAVCIPSTA